MSYLGQRVVDDHFVELRGRDAHCAGLLGDDAFGALAWDGVDFEEGEALALFVVDVVEADHAAAVEEVVEFGGDVLDFVGDAGVDVGGSDFVGESVVFGGIVEEFVVAEGYDFGDGEDVFFAVDFHHAAVKFAALDELFDEDGVVFGEGLVDGGHQILGAFHLGGGHAAAARGGLDEDGIAQPVGDVALVDVLPLVVEARFGHFDDVVAAHHGVAVAFVEGERRGVESAGGVLDVQQVEVALHYAVFAGVAVDDDEGKVEAHLVSVVSDGEVGAVDGAVAAVVGQPVPLLAVYSAVGELADDDLVDVVFAFVQRFVDLATAVDGYLMLAREASHYKCYVFHCELFFAIGEL